LETNTSGYSPIKPAVYIGIDIGTSGCRSIAIDDNDDVVSSIQTLFSANKQQDPLHWLDLFQRQLLELRQQLFHFHICSIAIDGTSGTLLLCDDQGIPITQALMYNDNRALEQSKRIAETINSDLPLSSASSSLAKLLWLLEVESAKTSGVHALHQSEWLTGILLNRFDLGDTNNCLKLGFNPMTKQWVNDLDALGINLDILPTVKAPGTKLGLIHPAMATKLKLPKDCNIIAGTTDSTAGVLATGAKHNGDAVTSLGSTMTFKILSKTPVFDNELGIYSHLINNIWITGGASNSGGAVLKQLFSDNEIIDLSTQLKPKEPTHLNYYPLIKPGERFPVNDPNFPINLSPVPETRAEYFQGIIEGMSHIEKQAYELLTSKSKTKIKRLFSIGGGSKNEGWKEIRENLLGYSLINSEQDEAAYGSALLAKQGVNPTS